MDPHEKGKKSEPMVGIFIGATLIISGIVNALWFFRIFEIILGGAFIFIGLDQILGKGGTENGW